MAAGSGQIPQEHLDILKRSGILNPDVTLEQIINAATELDSLATETETSVPTLVGNWYVYHTIEAIDQAVSPAKEY